MKKPFKFFVFAFIGLLVTSLPLTSVAVPPTRNTQQTPYISRRRLASMYRGRHCSYVSASRSESEERFMRSDSSDSARDESKIDDAVSRFKIGCLYQFGRVASKYLNASEPLTERAMVQNLLRSSNIDYSQALYWFELAAKQNYIPAKAHIAGMLLREQGAKIDVTRALSLLNEAVSADYVPAMNELGDIYYEGKYVPQDVQKAFDMYYSAAKEEFAPAMCNLAYMYELGIEPVKVDISLAMKLYEAAANKKSEHAAYRLATIHKEGLYGKEVDVAKAYHLYLQAAQLNHTPAMFELAQMYRYGNDIVRKDEKIALALYDKAANFDHAPAKLIMSDVYMRGSMGAVPNMLFADRLFFESTTRLSSEEKYNLAEMLVSKVIEYPKGVELGITLLNELAKGDDEFSLLAKDLLGETYENGIPEDGVEKDIKKAVSMYKSAAAKKDTFAQCALGRIYQTGDAKAGIASDRSLAISYYCDAARGGDAMAQNTLGLMYWHGSVVKKNTNKAVTYLQQAVEQGCTEAKNHLGFIYLSMPDKYPTMQDEAVKLIQSAAQQNYDVALYNLGYMYENGIGVSKDSEQAKKYYTFAADKRNAPAIEALKRFEVEDSDSKMESE